MTQFFKKPASNLFSVSSEDYNFSKVKSILSQRTQAKMPESTTYLITGERFLKALGKCHDETSLENLIKEGQCENGMTYQQFINSFLSIPQEKKQISYSSIVNALVNEEEIFVQCAHTFKSNL